MFTYCPFGKRHSSLTVRESERACARTRARASPATEKLVSLKLSDFPLLQAGGATMTSGAGDGKTFKLKTLQLVTM